MGILITFFPLLPLIFSIQTNYPLSQRVGVLAQSVKYGFENIQPK